MTWAERFRLARRYTFAFGQGHLSAFLSSLSMLGLVLAITLLIIVLSVMNGFDKEMRERILSLVPHITVYADLPVTDWQDYVERLAGPYFSCAAACLALRALRVRTPASLSSSSACPSCSSSSSRRCLFLVLFFFFPTPLAFAFFANNRLSSSGSAP